MKFNKNMAVALISTMVLGPAIAFAADTTNVSADTPNVSADTPTEDVAAIQDEVFTDENTVIDAPEVALNNTGAPTGGVGILPSETPELDETLPKATVKTTIVFINMDNRSQTLKTITKTGVTNDVVNLDDETEVPVGSVYNGWATTADGDPDATNKLFGATDETIYALVTFPEDENGEIPEVPGGETEPGEGGNGVEEGEGETDPGDGEPVNPDENGGETENGGNQPDGEIPPNPNENEDGNGPGVTEDGNDVNKGTLFEERFRPVLNYLGYTGDVYDDEVVKTWLKDNYGDRYKIWVKYPEGIKKSENLDAYDMFVKYDMDYLDRDNDGWMSEPQNKPKNPDGTGSGSGNGSGYGSSELAQLNTTQNSAKVMLTLAAATMVGGTLVFRYKGKNEVTDKTK